MFNQVGKHAMQNAHQGPAAGFGQPENLVSKRQTGTRTLDQPFHRSRTMAMKRVGPKAQTDTIHDPKDR
jgi:hypothetical protein